jgi:hypothetical protein
LPKESKFKARKIKINNYNAKNYIDLFDLLNEIDARNQANKPFTEHEIKLIVG